MKQSVSRNSLVVAFVAALISVTALSYLWQFILACLSALISLIPIVLGPSRLRIYAVAVVAIATWLAVSVYPDFQRMSIEYRLLRAVKLGTSLGAALDRRWNSTKSLPTSAEELDVPLPKDKIADVRFDTKDRFTVVLAPQLVSQGRLVFTAISVNGERIWKCAAQEFDSSLRPPGCREDYTVPDLPSADAAQPVDAPDRLPAGSHLPAIGR